MKRKEVVLENCSFLVVEQQSFVCVRVFFSRVVDDEICLTMDDGRSALKVLELDGKEVKKIAGEVGFLLKSRF